MLKLTPIMVDWVTLASANITKPTTVRKTSLKIPVMFIDIGPLIVTHKRAVIVIKIPKLPEIQM